MLEPTAAVCESCTISFPVKSFLKIAVVIVAALGALAEPVASLHPTNYVNDFAGVLDATTVAQLNDLCKQVDEKAKAQIAVAIVKSLDGQEAFDYGVALYQAWGIGKKGADRGVLILLSTQDHKYYINVGYGLEGILPDGKVGGFGREMVPVLRTGNYNAAVTLVTNRVAQTIAQDAGVTLTGAQEPEVRYRPSNQMQGPGAVLVLLLIVMFVLVIWAISRGGGGYRGGGGGGSFLWGLLWGLLMGNMRGGGGYRDRGFGGFGGGGFGGGFGGGGFGGFGGGSTGGGGAGGSW